MTNRFEQRGPMLIGQWRDSQVAVRGAKRLSRTGDGADAALIRQEGMTRHHVAHQVIGGCVNHGEFDMLAASVTRLI
jgi:hypothetical protein